MKKCKQIVMSLLICCFTAMNLGACDDNKYDTSWVEKLKSEEVQGDFSSTDGRREWLLKSLENAIIPNNGKHGIPFALARLEANPNDEKALDYLAHVLDEPETDMMFLMPNLGLALKRYKENFSKEQLDNLRQKVAPYAKQRSGFYDHGTENHAIMWWVGGYLLAQELPDTEWYYGETTEDILAKTKEYMRETFRQIYRKGYSENLSTSYEAAGTNPVMILYECADDPEVKAIAEAFLLYKWSLTSLNFYQGVTMAPYSRMNTQQDHAPTDYYVPGSSYNYWLDWGWGKATDNVTLAQFTTGLSDATGAIVWALLKIRPYDVFARIANKEESFEMRSSVPSFGLYGSGARNNIMRTGYRTKDYAIGTGNFNHIPYGYLDSSVDGFNIIWPSSNRFNYIGCFTPYFYKNGYSYPNGSYPDTWRVGNATPFRQVAHHKSTVLALFNIPNKDPWYNLDPVNGGTWKYRQAWADNLLKRAMLRYPKTMDEEVEEKGWIFLREGNTYIAIKSLRDYYIDRSEPDPSLIGFNVIKSDFAKSGFIFEVSSTSEIGTFSQFCTKVLVTDASIDFDQKNMILSYTNIKGEVITIEYLDGFPLVSTPDGEYPSNSVPSSWPSAYSGQYQCAIPTVTVDGTPMQAWEQWPLLESPYVNMDNSVLHISEGETVITVDWTGDLPIITK